MSTTAHSDVAVPAVADDEGQIRRSIWQTTVHFCRREPLGAGQREGERRVGIRQRRGEVGEPGTGDVAPLVLRASALHRVRPTLGRPDQIDGRVEQPQRGIVQYGGERFHVS